MRVLVTVCAMAAVLAEAIYGTILVKTPGIHLGYFPVILTLECLAGLIVGALSGAIAAVASRRRRRTGASDSIVVAGAFAPFLVLWIALYLLTNYPVDASRAAIFVGIGVLLMAVAVILSTRIPWSPRSANIALVVVLTLSVVTTFVYPWILAFVVAG